MWIKSIVENNMFLRKMASRLMRCFWLHKSSLIIDNDGCCSYSKHVMGVGNVLIISKKVFFGILIYTSLATIII